MLNFIFFFLWHFNRSRTIIYFSYFFEYREFLLASLFDEMFGAYSPRAYCTSYLSMFHEVVPFQDLLPKFLVPFTSAFQIINNKQAVRELRKFLWIFSYTFSLENYTNYWNNFVFDVMHIFEENIWYNLRIYTSFYYPSCLKVPISIPSPR